MRCTCFMVHLKQQNMSTISDLKPLLEDLDSLPVNQVKFNAHAAHQTTSYRMDSLHILELKKPANIQSYGKYIGVYHYIPASATPTQFEVHLAYSNDLVNWTYERTLGTSIDMPYLYRAEAVSSGGDEWIVMAHEQWNGSNNCKLGFQLFHNEDDLLAGTVAVSYTAPNFSGVTLQGTPNIYEAFVHENENGNYVLQAALGFHYHENNRDQIGNATLKDFGDTPEWFPSKATKYMDNITWQGATGNVGQRDFCEINGVKAMVQEGNIQGEDLIPTNFGAWQLWLYNWDKTQLTPGASWPTPEWPVSPFPTNPDEYYFYPIFPRTPNRSTSFGNPSIQVVEDPSDASKKVLFGSYIVFSEGAGQGEAGPVVFFQKLA